MPPRLDLGLDCGSGFLGGLSLCADIICGGTVTVVCVCVCVVGSVCSLAEICVNMNF